MFKTIVFVFAGGALGAVFREFLMLGVPKLLDGFPLDILLANLIASFLLGWVTALHSRKAVSGDVNTLLGTGVSGGLSTFSSFAYGVSVLMSAFAASAVVAAGYVVVSLVAGYFAISVGMAMGSQRAASKS